MAGHAACYGILHGLSLIKLPLVHRPEPPDAMEATGESTVMTEHRAMSDNENRADRPQPDNVRRKGAMKSGQPETWPKEIGGQEGPEPTRYGDWEKNGRCTDF